MTWGNNFIFLSLLVVFVIDQHGESDAARILGIFPLPGKSHFGMCETVMRALAARGHQVDVISHFPLKKPPPNYHDISIEGSVPAVINNLTLQRAETFASGNLAELVQNAGNMVCDLLALPEIRNIIDHPPTDPPYDLVITEVRN